MRDHDDFIEMENARRKYDDFTEMENPGELTGTLMVDEGVMYLLTDHVGYDISVAGELSMSDLVKSLGKEVTLRTDRVSRAGMVAPQLGHVVASGMAVQTPKMAP